LLPRAGPLASNIRVDGRMTRTLTLLRSTSRTGASTWDTCKSPALNNDVSILDQAYLTWTNFILLSRLWHGLVTFGCAITIPEEEADETRELLTPALVTASLTNDLFSFEKERKDTNVQNAVLVIMREHGCSEEEAREICKERIRVEVAKYVRVVKDTRMRTDLSDDVKRYIEVMQYTLSGNVAWSTQCPRYNEGAKFNELQLLRAEHGVDRSPAMWPPKNATDCLSVKTKRKEFQVNGDIPRNPLEEGNFKDGQKMYRGINNGGVCVSNGVNGVNDHSVGRHESTKANGHKRKRNGNSTGDDIRMNGTNGVKKLAHSLQPSTDSLVLADVVSLALDWNLPELSDDVSWTSSLRRFPSNDRHIVGAETDGAYQIVLQPYRYLYLPPF